MRDTAPHPPRFALLLPEAVVHPQPIGPGIRQDHRALVQEPVGGPEGGNGPIGKARLDGVIVKGVIHVRDDVPGLVLQARAKVDQPAGIELELVVLTGYCTGQSQELTMFNANKPPGSDLPSVGQLLRSTFVALCTALVLLVTIVLPAEYVIDLTGVGRLLQLTTMGEIRHQLAAESLAAAAASAKDPTITNPEPAAANTPRTIR